MAAHAPESATEDLARRARAALVREIDRSGAFAADPAWREAFEAVPRHLFVPFYYVGGAAGASVRKGDLLCVVESHEEAMKYMGRFVQYYREHAKYLERTYAFLERIGIEKLRRVLVEDAEGIAERLDTDLQSSVDAYIDPWKEAERPVHPTQFNTVLPIQGGSFLQVKTAPER